MRLSRGLFIYTFSTVNQICSVCLETGSKLYSLPQVWHIMQNARYGEDDDQIGILRLLANKSLTSAFPLHEVCV